jgi:serine protease Do
MQRSLSPNAATEANNMPFTGFGDIAEQLRRTTVLIHAGGRGNGSGIVWSSDGTIITNAHVARGPRLHVQLWDGRELDATVASRDRGRDLALLRVAATGLPAASAADSSQVRPGELAIAIGNPMGFVGALTTGVVHAVGPLRGLGPQSWVQADVRLAPGNSGGPLADARGRVIGVNTMVAGRLALAIPSNVVADFLAGGHSDAWLGVTLYPVQVPRPGRSGKTFGLVVLEVEPGSPAAQASLVAGDILLGADDKPFTLLEDLARALRGAGPRTLRVEFLRGDYARVRRVTIQLGSEALGRRSAAA